MKWKIVDGKEREESLKMMEDKDQGWEILWIKWFGIKEKEKKTHNSIRNRYKLR